VLVHLLLLVDPHHIEAIISITSFYQLLFYHRREEREGEREREREERRER
jgi:hypothetical protein